MTKRRKTEEKAYCEVCNSELNNDQLRFCSVPCYNNVRKLDRTMCFTCGVAERVREGCSYCRECSLERNRQNVIKNGGQKHIALKSNYGITLDDFNQMVEYQGGKCANPACDSDATDTDHCHVSLKIRGVLCGHCNKALGLLKDNEEIILGLWVYLTESQINNVRS